MRSALQHLPPSRAASAGRCLCAQLIIPHLLRCRPAARRRVNSSDALAAAEHIHTPLGTGRGTSVGQHVSIFAASPRSDGGIELAAAYTTGSGGGSLRSSAAGTPLAGTQQGGLVAKKNTPASAAETQMLLDRMAADAGGGSSAGVHLRASYTGGGSGTPNGFSPNAPGAAAVRSRLTSAL